MYNIHFTISSNIQNIVDTVSALQHPISLYIGLSCQNETCFAKGQFALSPNAVWTFEANQYKVC